MAFSLTFKTILDSNIRHLYSGTPSHMVCRQSKEYPNMDQLRQQRDNQHLKDSVLRVSEYDCAYKCLIPRAPAFRILSRHDVDGISDRLYSSKVGRVKEHSSSKEEDDQKPKSSPRQMSRKEMEEISERLYSHVTKATTIRVNQTKEAGHPPPMTRVDN